MEGDTANNNVSLLGMPAENDWVLNSLPYDETAMRDFIAYELSREMGQYAPRCTYCELVLNGQYNGLYMLGEKIKIDKNRVNITKTEDGETNGGYITKADKETGGDPIAWTMPSENNGYTQFIHHYPKPENITTAQNNYIHNVFNSLANATHSNNESITNGFPSIIDIPTFIDFMIMVELTSNVDAYQLSTFFHKDRNGKLRAGPIWDYNLSFGYDQFGWRSSYDVWQFDNNDNTGPYFWKELFENGTFRCYLAKRWKQLTQQGGAFCHQTVTSRIDQLDEMLGEAIERDNQRWGRMEYHDYYTADMKEWLALRISWLNQNIGDCEPCNDVATPPLVISKIHYHPMHEWGFDEKRLEFIEITNNGEEEVDLTGVCFKELGITYHFPAGSTIGGNGPYLKLIDVDYDNSLAESWTTCSGQDISGTHGQQPHVALSIFPNPSKGWANIAANDMVKINISNIFGQTVLSKEANGNHAALELSHLPSGIYIVSATTTSGIVSKTR